MSINAEDRRTHAAYVKATGENMGYAEYLELREMWRQLGGEFFGPNVEHGSIAEHRLLPMLRELREFRQPPYPRVAENFQASVHDWMLTCFGFHIANDGTERNHRFLEEAIELVQALGCTKPEAQMLVDYVYGRVTGQPKQEVGGVMVTLAALCTAAGIDMSHCAGVELHRVWRKIDDIRKKQAAKPRGSPLP